MSQNFWWVLKPNLSRFVAESFETCRRGLGCSRTAFLVVCEDRFLVVPVNRFLVVPVSGFLVVPEGRFLVVPAQLPASLES